MANSRSSKKNQRKSDAHYAHNRTVRATTRTHIRHVLTAVAAGDVAAAGKAFGALESWVDKAARRRIYHPNTAARFKSRLRRKISAATASGKKT